MESDCPDTTEQLIRSGFITTPRPLSKWESAKLVQEWAALYTGGHPPDSQKIAQFCAKFAVKYHSFEDEPVDGDWAE